MGAGTGDNQTEFVLAHLQKAQRYQGMPIGRLQGSA
jgi:hypothetical protein